MRRPTKQTIELGRALAEVRRQAGLRQGDAAELLGCSQPTIARVESGSRKPTSREVSTLLEHCAPSAKLREQIDRLMQYIGEETGPRLNPGFVDMVNASEAAEAIHAFHSERLPMVLQCERYVLKQYFMYDSATDPHAVLQLRSRRMQIFTQSRPPEYRAILSMSSLLRMPGGQLDLVREQAQHLLHLLDVAPSLTVRVLDFAARIPFVDSDFTLVVERTRGGRLVYIPFGLDGLLIRDKVKIDERAAYWRQVEQAALTQDQTRKLLRSLAEGGSEAAMTIGWSA